MSEFPVGKVTFGPGVGRMNQFTPDLNLGTIKVRPKIVCICGSTSFKDEWFQAMEVESLAGRIVLAVGSWPHADRSAGKEEVYGLEVARQLDELHLRRIDLADEILVLNVAGYIGESTRREIAYARQQGKPVRFLEGKG